MYYFILILTVLIIILFFVLTNLLRRVKLKKVQRKNIELFRQEHKLKNSELDIFKQVMKETKELILSFEKLIDQSKRFHSEVLIDEALQGSQAIFKYLMSNPKKLTDFGDFLYKLLPTVVEACVEFVQIDHTKVQTAQIRMEEEEILGVIVSQSQRIKLSYEQVVIAQGEEVALNQKAANKEIIK